MEFVLGVHSGINANAAVLNASMNAHGHPLVRTSGQAVSFRRHHKLDGLLLGNALIC